MAHAFASNTPSNETANDDSGNQSSHGCSDQCSNIRTDTVSFGNDGFADRGSYRETRFSNLFSYRPFNEEYQQRTPLCDGNIDGLSNKLVDMVYNHRVFVGIRDSAAHTRNSAGCTLGLRGLGSHE